MTAPEPAGVWIRVSSGGQDERNQEPDVLAYLEAHGYAEARRYVVHGKSASKGEHQADLDAALADMRAGIIRVLVIWHSDRLERRPAKVLLDVLAEFAEAGGRVESVQEPTLGQLDMGGQLMTFVTGLMNHEKSRHLSEQVALALDRIRENGALSGRPPWGYTTTGPKYARVLIPTPDGLKYVPVIFQKIIRGESLARVCRWLDGEGVLAPGGGKWWPKSVGKLVRNPTYQGLRCAQDPETGAYSEVLHRCEPVVPGDVWKAANARLDARPRRGPRLAHAAMLTSAIFCARCEDSPLYRTHAGHGNPYFYYRCTGRGPDRHSCGLMVRLDKVDAAVNRIAAASFARVPVMLRVFVPGTDQRAEIEQLKYERAHLDQDAEDYDERHAALGVELKHLRSLPSVPGHWEERETGETYADVWASLDPAERGPWLAKQGCRVEASKEAVKLSQPGHPQKLSFTVKLAELAA
jgi:DNA invertase Pin-like site-specific DNA recombinase